MQKHSLITAHRLLIPSLALLALLALAPRAALAQRTWNGGGDGATWESNLNWNNLSYPGTTANDQEARFTNSPANTVTMNTALTIGGLDVNNAAATDVSVTVTNGGTFAVGQSTAPKTITVARNLVTYTHRTGSFSLTNGAFNAYLSTLTIGRNDQTGGSTANSSANGTLDLSGVNNVVLDVSNLLCGYGLGASGTLNLSGNNGTLTVQTLSLGRPRYSHGTLNLGSDWNITVGKSPTERGNFYAGYNEATTGNSTGTITLDGGTLNVYVNNFIVGRSAVHGGYSATVGTLDFSSITNPVTIYATTMEISRNTTSTAAGTRTDGTLDLSGSTNGTLTVGTLSVGHGQKSVGTLNLGSGWDITVGDRATATPGNVYVGYTDINQQYTQPTGTITLPDGGTGTRTLDVYADKFMVGWMAGWFYTAVGTVDFSSITNAVTIDATTLEIGRKTNPNSGGATGTLDLGNANVTLTAGTLIVGSGVNATGTLKLGPGSGTVGTATINDGSTGSSGRLDLNGTRLAVSSALTVGTLGLVRVTVGDKPAGLDLPDSAEALVIGSTVTGSPSRGMLITFTGPQASGVYWGLRWAGSHAQTLTDLKTAGKLNWNDDAIGGGVEIFEQGGFTYVGKIVPPRGTMILMR